MMGTGLDVTPTEDGRRKRRSDYMVMSYLEQSCGRELQELVDNIQRGRSNDAESQEEIRERVQYVAGQTQDTALASSLVPSDHLEDDVKDVAIRLEQDTEYGSPIHFTMPSSNQYGFNDRLAFCIRTNKVSAERGAYGLTMKGKEALQEMRSGVGVYSGAFDDGFAEVVDELVDDIYSK